MRWGWTPPKSSTFRRTSTRMGRRRRSSRLLRAKSAAPSWRATQTAAASACAKRSAPTTALPPDAVLVGNGTADLIWLLAHAYGFQRQAAILSPTFSEYADGVIMAGGHPIHLTLPGWQRNQTAPLRPERHNTRADAEGIGDVLSLDGLYLQSEQPHGRVSVAGRVALSVGRRARCSVGHR